MSFKLPDRSREGLVTRLPRPEYQVPDVTVDEVDIAIDLIVDKYKLENGDKPLAPHAETIRNFAFGSRQSAFTVVEIGCALAEAEWQLGNRQWCNEVWLPALEKARKEGEALPDSIRQGNTRRASWSERRLIVKAMGPIFIERKFCSDELAHLIKCAVIGAYYDEENKKLVWSCVGVRLSLMILKLLAGEEAFKGFEEDLKQAYKQDKEFIKAKREEKRRAAAATEAAETANPETEESEEDAEAEENAEQAV